jgi:RHS repeat-associated protein
MRDNAGVHYVLADHLGSSTVVTVGAGVEEGTMKYYPYGAERPGSDDMPTDKLFTGQQSEAGVGSVLGLYNYGARFYSTLTGRFVSADPLVPDASDVAKVLGPALMVTLPSAFSGRGGDSVYGPVVGLARGDQTAGLYIYVPPDDDVSDAWPAEGFTPRQDLLGVDDLRGDTDDEAPAWPVNTFAPNPQSLCRFAYVLGNPLRYTDPTGYWCPGPDAVCDAVGEAADTTLDALAKAGQYMRDTAMGCLECWHAELELIDATLALWLFPDDPVAWIHFEYALARYQEACGVSE